jgi:hypothetical protein
VIFEEDNEDNEGYLFAGQGRCQNVLVIFHIHHMSAQHVNDYIIPHFR